jgi:hypothetical protein
VEAGYIELESAEPEVIPASEKFLLDRRRYLFGRLVAMRVMHVPGPHYAGFSLFRNWLELGAAGKMRSLGGTWARIISRWWMKPLKEIVPDDQGPGGKQDKTASVPFGRID